MRTSSTLSLVLLVPLLLVGCGTKRSQPAADIPPAQEVAMDSSDWTGIESPAPNVLATSPITVRGKAPKDWFIDGSLAVQLIDLNGAVIAETKASATTATANASMPTYEAQLPFEQTGVEDAALLVKKGNTSGDPAQDAQFRVRVRFYDRPTELSAPEADAMVTSPLIVRGKASKSWFWDGSLPIQLVDFNGAVIAEGRATIVGPDKDSDYPDFEGVLEFEQTGVQDAEVVIKKDNPSHLLSHDAELRSRVKFYDFPTN